MRSANDTLHGHPAGVYYSEQYCTHTRYLFSVSLFLVQCFPCYNVAAIRYAVHITSKCALVATMYGSPQCLVHYQLRTYTPGPRHFYLYIPPPTTYPTTLHCHTLPPRLLYLLIAFVSVLVLSLTTYTFLCTNFALSDERIKSVSASS